MKFIKNHILGLLGIALLFFILAHYLSAESFYLDYIDRLILVIYILILPIGIALCLAEFLPERIKISLNNLKLDYIIDNKISKYGISILSFLIIIGFYLRFNSLGNLSFWFDELITSYAAIGILQQGAPVLPSGTLYTRSIFNTSLIALSFKVFGVSEFSARIVSVVFGTLTIPLVYLMGTKIANRRVGLLATVLITFSSLEIVWSQQARMYAQFQFFYLLTAYLFYLGLNKHDARILSLSAISFMGAYLDHILAITFLPVAVVYILFRKRKLFKNKYFMYGGVAILGLATLYMVVSKIPLKFISQDAPMWAKKPFYYYVIAPDLKILLFLVFIGTTVAVILWKLRVLESKSSNLYILFNFFIPFLILSIYSMKAPRYALFIYPFLVLLISNAVDLYVVQNIISEKVCTRISKTVGPKIDIVRKIKNATLFLMVLLLFVQMVSSMDAYVTQKYVRDINATWREGSEYVKNRFVEGDKIMTTVPLATLYYLGEEDYFLRQFEYNGIINNEGQLVDIYAGGIILNSYGSFMEVINNSRGWVIADNRLDGYFTDPMVRDYIKNNMTFHPDGSDDTIKVYSWGT